MPHHFPFNAEARRGLLMVAGMFSLLLWAGYIYGLHWKGGWLFDDGPLVMGRDFMNFWMVGQAAWDPDRGPWYDLWDHSRRLQAMLGKDYALQQWSYPPSLMILAAPFGLLPYGAALGVWIGLQALLAAWLWRRHPSETRLLLLSPAFLMAAVSGQASLFFLGLLIAVFAWLERRPLLSGTLVGLFGVKPQLVLLLPVAWLAQRRWRAIGMAALSTLSLAALVILIYGWAPWVAYLTHGLPDQAQIAVDPPRNIAALMPSFFVELHFLKLPETLCRLGQALLGLVAAWLVWRGFRFPEAVDEALAQEQAALRFALFAAASVLASPYWMNYDLLIVSWAVVRLLHLRDWPAREQWLCVAVYFLPALCLVMHTFYLPGIPLIPLALAWWACRRLREISATSQEVA